MDHGKACTAPAGTLRVLHVWPSLDQRSGGPLRAILDLSANSSAYGLHSEVLGFGPINVPDNPLEPHLLHSLPVAFPRRYCYVPQLPRWLVENLRRYDGVVIHGLWLYPHWAVARACAAAGVPYACFPHGMLEPWSIYGQGVGKKLKKVLYWWLRERGVFRRSVALMFTTPRERDMACRALDLPQKRFIVTPYGIETRPRVERPMRADMVLSPGLRMALFLGRVHPKKNVHFLIEAWARARVPSDWQLYIAGPCDGEYQQTLDGLVQKHGLEGKVRFVGMVTGADKTYLLQRADWFLLPSQQENFGVAVLEAMGCGCAVAVSDQVYIADYFPARSDVLPVEMDAWVDFLRHRMTDESRRQTQIAANQHIIPQFRMETVARAWAATMREVFQKSPA